MDGNSVTASPKTMAISEVVKHPLVAWVAAFFLLLFTGLAWKASYNAVHQRLTDRFNGQVSLLQTSVERRMVENISILRAGAGLFLASDTVTRNEWHAFVESLQTPTYYPGMGGVGFFQGVPRDQLAAYTARIRAEGFPDFHVWPEGDRAFYAVVTYLEPFSGRNLRAFGYDVFSEPIRRAALEYARDSGEPGLTGMIKLVQETTTDVQNGFIIAVPLYHKGMPTTNPSERRAALEGFVYSPFRVNDLMSGILGGQDPQIGMDIFDGDAPTQQSLLFRLINTEPPANTDLTITTPVKIGGHTWTIHYYALPHFYFGNERYLPGTILGVGIVIDLLLFILLTVFTQRRLQAEAIAAAMTARLTEANRLQIAINEQLRDSELRYRSLIDSQQEYIVRLDGQGQFSFVNETFARACNTPADALIGTRWESVTHPDDIDQIAAIIDTATHTPGKRFAAEARLVAADRITWVAWEGCGISSDGIHVNIQAAGRDISERKTIDERLTSANRELEQFAYVASHDLRQPLRTISSYLNLIRRNLDRATLNDELQQYFHFAIGGAKRMDRLIVDLLEYSRTGRGIDPLTRLDLGEAISDSLANLHSAIQESGAKITVDHRPAPLNGIRSELVRLFQNLIGNAIKYAAPDRPAEIEIGWRDDHGGLVVWVRDNGMGIDPAQQDRAFMIFQRLVSRDSHEGTGIGLAVCKKIVEHHGGKIWIESALGIGSTFFMTFPVAPKSGAASRPE